jgi:hypothetical protein
VNKTNPIKELHMSRNLRDKMLTRKAEYKAVGRYAKQTDPGMIEMLEEDGYPTTLEAIGQVIEQSDPEMFDHILNDILGNID